MNSREGDILYDMQMEQRIVRYLNRAHWGRCQSSHHRKATSINASLQILMAIFLHRQFQCGQPGGRVVEVRNRLVKPAVEVGEVRLNAAERRRRLIGLIGCFEDVVGAGVFDEDVAAEEVPRRAGREP